MIKGVVSLLLGAILVFVLNRPWNLGETSIPPLGKFLMPTHGFWQNAEVQSPNKDEYTIATAGTDDVVNVYLDDRAVPHIFASSAKDAVYAQGYLTAQNRLFQMDVFTRSSEGSLSELLGDITLEYDRQQRIYGVGWAAEKAIEHWKKYPESYALVSAYCQGINDYIQTLSDRNLPLEYKILNAYPLEWTVYHSALVLKRMSLDLCFGERDLENSNTVEIFGKPLFDSLMPAFFKHQDPIIPKGTPWDFEPIDVPENEHVIPKLLGDQAPYIGERKTNDLLGSNNWAIAGTKTASGHPIVCNDPHLSLSLPSIWYENHIVTADYNCYGVSIPGMPHIIIGFNENIAWGVTNVGHDVLDWYTIDWTDESKEFYYLDGIKTAVEHRIEEIAVNGQPSVFDTIKYAKWGPISETGNYTDLAMKWVSHLRPLNDEVGTFYALNKSSNFDDYRKALEKYMSPAQNFVFADKSGDIAMTIAGALPLRRKEQGKFVSDGSKGFNDWAGFIPYEHNPFVRNPERGFVSSANQHTTDTTYPYYYDAFPYFEDYRGRTLNNHLSADRKFDRASMKSIQNDNTNLKCLDLLPTLLSVVNGHQMDEDQTYIFEQLVDFNCIYKHNDQAPIYFERWYSLLNRAIWDEFYIHREKYISYPERWFTIDMIVNDPSNPYFDDKNTEAIEYRNDIVLSTFENLSKSLREDGVDIKHQTWCAHRKNVIRHISRIPGLGHTLTKTSGHGDALNATHRTGGPSWRMIVELSDPVVAEVVYPGGQSGNPGSKYYMTGVDKWEEGKYYSVTLSRDPKTYKDQAIAQISFK